MNVIKNKVRAFLLQNTRKKDLDDATDIFSSKLVNSLFALQLVVFIEKEFNLVVENDDLDINNFRSVNAIGEFVKKKRLGSAAMAQ